MLLLLLPMCPSATLLVSKLPLLLPVLLLMLVGLPVLLKSTYALLLSCSIAAAVLASPPAPVAAALCG